MSTQDEKIVTEEEKKADIRYEELNKKADRTEEEEKEFGEVKKHYGERMQKKINEYNWRTRTAEEKAAEAERRADEAEARAKELEEAKPPEKTVVKEEFIKISGKNWYTDEALAAQIKDGTTTEAEAYSYQRKRDREETIVAVEQRQVERTQRESNEKTMREDFKQVDKKYPHFNKKHPDFNSEDPLYKLADEIYREGYAANPKGLSLAIKRAKEILRIQDTPIDRSEDLNLESSEAPSRTRKDTEVTLSDDEKELAIKTYTLGDAPMNPKTGRSYTEREAIGAALEAKKGRKTRRIT